MTDQKEIDTPVAIIIFRRPGQTKKLIDAMRSVAPRKIYVIADGPRREIYGEAQLVSATRSEIQRIDWPCEVIHVYADENLGLRQRVLTGLDYVFEREKEAIILEDDCIPAASFFNFSTELLEKYRFAENVSIISGSNFSPNPRLGDSYFFYSGSFIWGWATWSRTWLDFRSSPHLEEWDSTDQNKTMETFYSSIAALFFRPMMLNARNLNTWDISFEVFLRLNSYISVVPKLNLVANIGFGDEATHTKLEPFDSQAINVELNFPLSHPERVKVTPRNERSMWRTRLLRWACAPLRHPLVFFRAFRKRFAG